MGTALGSAATDAVETASSTAAEDTTSAATDVAGACGLSFSADTTVATPDGEKPIATLLVGDQVQAFDPTTKQQTTQTVQKVFINHDIDLIDVTLTLDPGTNATTNAVTGTTKQQEVAVVSHGSHAPPTSKTETIHTTEKHPWLTTKGWIKAGELHLGDHVLRLDGTTGTIVALHLIPGEEDMYDLTVSNIHTFAVGAQQFVVHNVQNCGGKALALDAQSVSKTLEGTIAREDRRFLTVASGVLQDADGNIVKVVSTNGGASAGMKNTIGAAAGLFGQDFIEGDEHAEVNIVNYAEQNNLKLLAIGTSRQACAVCKDFMGGFFDVGETNLDLLPRSYRPSLWWNES